MTGRFVVGVHVRLTQRAPRRKADAPTPMKIAYLVSRFPVVSETFVVREIDAVSARPGLEVELRALYPAKAEGMVQPISAPWVPRVRRPAPAAALAAVGWWAPRARR